MLNLKITPEQKLAREMARTSDAASPCRSRRKIKNGSPGVSR